MLENRLSAEREKHNTLTEQTIIALNEGREDLAEAAISKQMDIEAQLPIMEKSLFEATDHIKELEGYIAALQAKKREMQEELELFKKSKLQTPNATVNTPEAKVDKAQAAFERVMGVSASAARITSYNVCYTKLLRNSKSDIIFVL